MVDETDTKKHRNLFLLVPDVRESVDSRDNGVSKFGGARDDGEEGDLLLMVEVPVLADTKLSSLCRRHVQ